MCTTGCARCRECVIDVPDPEELSYLAINVCIKVFFFNLTFLLLARESKRVAFSSAGCAGNFYGSAFLLSLMCWLWSVGKMCLYVTGADCSSRRLRFVASELTDLTTKFDADAIVYSLQHCARTCYETGCTFAAFTRFPRPVCLMRYSNATAFDCESNAKRTTSWRFSGIQQVVRLDCIKCGMY